MITKRRLSLVFFCVAALSVAGVGPASAKVFLSADEALALAFPGCVVERQTVFLSDAQRKRAEKLAEAPLESALVYPYRGICDGKLAGVAYFDIHRVRTLPERLMVVVDPTGKIARIEVLTFDEPRDYKPKDGWYGQFIAKGDAGELRLGEGIHKIAGATLTGRATAAAARRVVAIHRVLNESP